MPAKISTALIMRRGTTPLDMDQVQHLLDNKDKVDQIKRELEESRNAYLAIKRDADQAQAAAQARIDAAGKAEADLAEHTADTEAGQIAKGLELDGRENKITEDRTKLDRAINEHEGVVAQDNTAISQARQSVDQQRGDLEVDGLAHRRRQVALDDRLSEAARASLSLDRRREKLDALVASIQEQVAGFDEPAEGEPA